MTSQDQQVAAGTIVEDGTWLGKLHGELRVPESRRLARLATAPVSRATCDLGYAWSRWRRRHQARARWHHYHAQLLKAARLGQHHSRLS